MTSKRDILLISLALGFIIGAYTVVSKYFPGVLVCPSGGLVDCGSVINSSYGSVFGIPVGALGVVWYFVSALLLFRPINKLYRNLWLIVGLGGIVYSTSVMTILGKLCIYCSAMDLLIALSVYLFIYGNVEPTSGS